MYLPKHFLVTDLQKTEELLRSYPFVTLLSFPEENAPFINHLPLLLEPSRSKTLIGHMAKANPQWRHFEKNSKCVAIVQGPHTYITPTWYRSGRDVPTWNYAVSHIYGSVKLIPDFDGQCSILKKLVAFFEESNPNRWEFELPDDLNDEEKLTAAIISFEISIESIEAKFKLSQNRTEEDQDGVIEGLSTRLDENSREIQKMMNKKLPM